MLGTVLLLIPDIGGHDLVYSQMGRAMAYVWVALASPYITVTMIHHEVERPLTSWVKFRLNS